MDLKRYNDSNIERKGKVIMTILHLGDLHLGKRLGEFELIDDQTYILDQILDMAKEHQVEALLIAGDVYDKSIPSEAAVHLFDYFLRRLTEEKIKTFVISGNHDSDERLGFGSSLFEANGLYFATKYEGELYHQPLQDEFGEVEIYLLPFIKSAHVRRYYPEENITNYDEAVKVAIKHGNIDRNKRNVIVAHQFVAGKNLSPELAGSEGLSVQQVGLVEQIGTDCFEDFDYVALGHIHSAQKLERETIRYSGSPLKYSLSEIQNQKSVPLITLGEKGTVDVELLALKPRREMRHIKGKLREVLKDEHLVDTDDYIYMTLTDEEVVNDAMGIIRQSYPNTIKLDYENSHTKEVLQAEITKEIQEKSFEELIGDFYALMYGTSMTEEEKKVMQEVAREAGVLHEAD